MIQQHNASRASRSLGDNVSDEQQALALENDFEGARRPHATADRPCDPMRYWDFYSNGTD
jgi:hypothetical protein